MQSVGLGAVDCARPITDRWWEQYGDPQFDQLVATALERNPCIQQTLARVRAAQSQVTLAVAQRTPGVTLNGAEQPRLLARGYIYPPPFGGGIYWSGQYWQICPGTWISRAR